MTDDAIQQLRAIPIFAGLEDAELRHVAALATAFDVAAGHVLAEPHQPGAGMFVIVDGTVQVQVPDGTQVTLGPGEFVGELSILADVDRVARVRASTPVRGFAISRSAFAELLAQHPGIAAAMLPVVARRLADLEGRLGG